MKLSFEINENYLVYSALDRRVEMEGWVGLQNELWEKHLDGYKLLKGKHHQVFLEENPISELSHGVTDLENMLEETKQIELYNTLFRETEEYKNWLESEWDKNRKAIGKEMKSILKIDTSGIKLRVIVVSNKMRLGLHIGEGTVVWGHSEDFQNYNLVYLMHEMIHDVLNNNDLTHAVIELATDNELRIRLNGEGEYFYIDGRPIGHKNLLETEKKILNDWQEYLDDSNQDIFAFVKELEGKHPELK